MIGNVPDQVPFTSAKLDTAYTFSFQFLFYFPLRINFDLDFLAKSVTS